MSIVNTYLFNNLGRIGADHTDNSQRNVSNTKFGHYMLSSYSPDGLIGSHVNFATQQPSMMFSGTTHGTGLSASSVDIESKLRINPDENTRSLERLQLRTRPFLTVPYLGRGSANPTLESQLMQGEIVSDRKSVSTISEKSYNADYALFHGNNDKASRSTDPKYLVEESAMDGWIRGGSATREFSQNFYKNQ